jgi:hypothetical protein
MLYHFNLFKVILPYAIITYYKLFHFNFFYVILNHSKLFHLMLI